jgi:hypothetical protein
MQDEGTLLAARVVVVEGLNRENSSSTPSATPAGIPKVVLDQMVATVRSMAGFFSDPRVSANVALGPLGDTLLRSITDATQREGEGMPGYDMLAGVATFRREMDLKIKVIREKVTNKGIVITGGDERLGGVKSALGS